MSLATYYRSLSSREQRTIRRAGIALGVTVVFYVVTTGYEWLGARAEAYQTQREAVETAQSEALRQRTELMRYELLHEDHPIDFEKAKDPNLITVVRPTLERLASEWGVECKVEEQARGRKGTSRTLQVDLAGSSEKVLGFYDAVVRSEFPLTVERFALTRDETKPGHIGLSVKMQLVRYEIAKKKKKRGSRA